jgi:hypothetical protein
LWFEIGAKSFLQNLGVIGKCAPEIKTDLDLVYGENVLPHCTITMWMSMFKEVRTYIRIWRPIFATSEKDISTVKAIVDEDARFTGHSASYAFSS